MNALILVNPHAAGGRARKLMPLMKDQCELHRSLFEELILEMPESIEAGLQLLRQASPDTRVVLVGGDGTLNQMLPGLMNPSFQIGLVPYGSGNDCARAWGLHGLKWPETLQFALSGQARRMDIGSVELSNGRKHYFHSSLAVGFDASVGNRALAGPKFLSGLPRYLLATFRELAKLRNWDMRISTDGVKVHQGTTLLASTLNTASYGGGMPAVPHAQINDGQLNLLIAGQFNRLQTLWMLPRLLLGLHLGHSRIKCEAFQSAEINSTELLPLAADGESLGHTQHLKIQVLPSALNVVRKN
jgi:diacylglycerol kinase (ATP)